VGDVIDIFCHLSVTHSYHVDVIFTSFSSLFPDSVKFSSDESSNDDSDPSFAFEVEEDEYFEEQEEEEEYDIDDEEDGNYGT